MSDSSSRKSTRRADLFSVPCGPLTDELIEWPEDEAEAAALTAMCKKIGDQYRAVRAAVPDEKRWFDASIKIMTAVRYYLEAHADAIREVGGHRVYSDDFRRFVLALASDGRPGDGMPLAELAFSAMVPLAVLQGWLASPTDP